MERRNIQSSEDVAYTADIQESLSKKQLLPSRHFVDAGYIDAALLVESAEKHDLELFGPARFNPSWQARTGGYTAAEFEIDWKQQTARCPAGKRSSYWHQYQTREKDTRTRVKIRFNNQDCANCPERQRCVKPESKMPRSLNLPIQPLYEALQTTRKMLSSEDGRREYRNRAGIEGTLSQGVRRGSLRRSRYIGLPKTHLQQTAIASGLNLLRTVNFLNKKPLAQTRTSRFAKLAL